MQPISSTATRRPVWILVLALSPLAYLGSFYLSAKLGGLKHVTSPNFQQAVAIAQREAAERHVDTEGWSSSISVIEHKGLQFALEHNTNPALHQLATGSEIHVRLRSPDAHQWFRVQMAPDGRVLGFSQNDPPATPPAITENEARTIAEAAVRSFLGPSSGLQLDHPAVRTNNTKRQKRTVDWKARLPGTPDAKADFTVQLTGDRVVGLSVGVTVEGKYLNQFRPWHSVATGVIIAAIVYVGFMGIYAIVRYVRRVMEREIAHWRTILVTAVFVVFSGFSMYSAAMEGASTSGEFTSRLQQIVMMGLIVLMFSLFGWFFGMAYGAGEGDVRAAYPGKLTSLDALLSGKIFSANVARSVLAGGSFAGALLLLVNLTLWLCHAANPLSEADIITPLVSFVSLGAAVSYLLFGSLVLVTFGLLLPISFFRPRLRRDWLFYTVVPLFCMLSASFNSGDEYNWISFILTMIGAAAAACIPFFYGDLLAALSSVLAFWLISEFMYGMAASEGWVAIAKPAIYAGVAFLAAEVWFAERGRSYTEWEVRPRYARFQAEHIALQAELSAARQAQLRLLPDAPPSIAGLSIAGCCIPAREVGGDFYDFYPLDDHRLGVFLAEGGSRELGSAMTIALAKGFLLHITRQDLAPVEILRRLREELTGVLREGGHVAMLYAVIDTRTATVRFARTGNSPRLAIQGSGVVEQVVTGTAGEAPLRHGMAELQHSQALIFFTDGLPAQIAEERRQSIDRFLAKTFSRLKDAPAATLHEAILKGAVKRKNDHPADDVTIVVIRLEEISSQRIGVVA